MVRDGVVMGIRTGKWIFILLIISTIVLFIYHVLYLAVSIIIGDIKIRVLGIGGINAILFYTSWVLMDLVLMILIYRIYNVLGRGRALDSKTIFVLIILSIFTLNLPVLFYTLYCLRHVLEK